MGRRPDDQYYDPTTLLVPSNFIKSKKCSDIEKQYWQLKQDNFDKVIFFKKGCFYDMLFHDAIIGNQVLDLNWIKNDPSKLRVSFPEKCLEDFATRLVEAGSKVAEVVLIQRPEETAKTSGVIENGPQREISNVFTKGTYLNTNNNANNLNYQNKFCISLVCNIKGPGSRHLHKIDMKTYTQTNLNCESSDIYEWGFVIFDVTTLKFYVGSFTEEEKSFNKILTLLYNISPEEVILMRDNIPLYILNFIKTLSSKPQITYLRDEYNVILLNKICTNFFGENLDDWNKIVLKYVSEEESYRNLCCALYVTICFLEKILLADQCLKLGNFEEYENPNKILKNQRLFLDYHAVTNLELIETKLDPKNPEAGSLIEYMNRAVTQFGKRMFKTWLLNPLANLEEIEERLNMVEDIAFNDNLLALFRNELDKWPDIERQVSKIYKYAISNSKAPYFEDVSKNRLKDFFSVVNFLEKSVDIFKIFDPYKNNFKSKKLLQKVNYEEGGTGCVPDIKKELEMFSKNFEINNITYENKPNVVFFEPKAGIYPQYDDYKQEISNIEQKFDDILKKERRRLNCAEIKYTHAGCPKYSLEIPEEYVVGSKTPTEYKLTTFRKGFLSFHTDEILELVNILESLHLKLKDEATKLNVLLFKEFYKKSPILNDYIKNIAELDCLATLAMVSTQSEGIMTRPKFITLEENKGKPYLYLEKSRHPCLSTRSHSFVSNDIIIGNNGKTTIVITGPNMGGKSTLLRQACICAIIGQMGCYVPAKKCVLTIIDRIFTRIGAKDKLEIILIILFIRILEGKSTFYVEMEETKTIMSYATINSLVIMDELGRGTSTQDGIIIAKTILDTLEKRIKCRTLFTTHYHGLKDWCMQQPGMGLYFTDCVVDENLKDILYLYKFRDGFCPQSHGIHVAKSAGLPVKYFNKIIPSLFQIGIDHSDG
jgi:DNA mismatch repair protein MSH6